MSRVFTKPSQIILSILLLLLGLASDAFALQTLRGKDGDTLAGRISIRERTRIAVESGFIRQAVINPKEVEYERDDKSGLLWVRPTTEDRKPINIDVQTSTGSWITLLLEPVDLPSDSIVISDKSADKRTAPDGSKAGSYERAIKNFLLAMVTGKGRGVEVLNRGETVPLWNEVWFVLQQTFSGANFNGEKYRLVNKTAEPMVISEQEFFRPKVVGVSIEQTSLPPGGATWVYVITNREGPGDE